MDDAFYHVCETETKFDLKALKYDDWAAFSMGFKHSCIKTIV